MRVAGENPRAHSRTQAGDSSGKYWEESMRIFLGGAAAVVLGLACAGCGQGVSKASAADTAKAPAESVMAVGCPKTPKPDCVTVTADGKTWDVTSAKVCLLYTSPSPRDRQKSRMP